MTDKEDKEEQEFQKEKAINQSGNKSKYHAGRFADLEKTKGRRSPPKAPEGKGKPETVELNN